jgi:hypothetical protein
MSIKKGMSAYNIPFIDQMTLFVPTQGFELFA